MWTDEISIYETFETVILRPVDILPGMFSDAKDATFTECHQSKMIDRNRHQSQEQISDGERTG